MGCCGQNDGTPNSKCNLCSSGGRPKDFSPWGKKRKICWRCRDKQLALIEEREKLNARAKRLMSGVGE